MDLTNEQIEEEFKRQVRLCSGIGGKKMTEIINSRFPNSDNRKLKRLQASINGSLDELEMDNTSDVIEKSFVIKELKVLLNILNQD